MQTEKGNTTTLKQKINIKWIREHTVLSQHIIGLHLLACCKNNTYEYESVLNIRFTEKD